MSKAVFQKLGKTFKRNNSHNHTHAFGIKYHTKFTSGKIVASWGKSEAHAKENLANRLGVSAIYFTPGLHFVKNGMGYEISFHVEETETVEVI
jgi:hypothetical protein